MILKALVLTTLVTMGQGSVKYDPTLEYAAYKGRNSTSTIVVTRKEGAINLLWCHETFYPDDANRIPNTDAVAKFAAKYCVEPQTVDDINPTLETNVSTKYISGGVRAVVSIAQVYEHPDSSNSPDELSSVMSTYHVKTWPTNPVGLHDTVIYTGASIGHDHGATPRLSTTRMTFELVGVTRAKKQ